MLRSFSRFGPLASGATLGGLLVGFGEALYRDVSLVYASLLYGLLWAAVGSGVALVLSPLFRDRDPPQTQIRWGMMLALVPSTLVLTRFILLRDLLLESPSAGTKALAGAGIAALVVFIAVWTAARATTRRLRTEIIAGNRVWAIPIVVLVAFALRAQAGDDDLPDGNPQPKRLAGGGVILVVVDTLRADVLGAYGGSDHRAEPPSPHFDALAAHGRLYQDASAQASWTRPAVATLLTSRHVSGHDTMSKAAILPVELPTIATELGKVGVKSGAVVTNYNLEEAYGFSRGFDEFSYLAPARYLGAPARANRLAAYNVYRLLRERLFKSARESRHFYRDARTVNAAGMEILDRIGDSSFFLWLHYMEPHDPYFDIEGSSYAKVSDPHPPPAWADRMRQAYRDDVRRFDEALGGLLDAIEARGISERTTVIVVADHGEEFAEHGGYYHGATLYEEQLHVPLLIAGPGVTPGVDTELAQQIDIAPTVLARFAVNPPASWEGRDLLGGTEPPVSTLAEENHEGNVLASVRQGDMKLILANQDNPRGLQPEELFNLAEDPGETRNLAGADPAVAELRDELLALKTAAKSVAAEAAEVEMNDERRAELRSLGYIK